MPFADWAFGVRAPWSSRLAHEQHRRTSATLISAEKTFRLINWSPYERSALLPSVSLAL